MLQATFLTGLGFGLLFWGAEWLVKGGAGLALRIGLSALVVGLTVVAYGTSAPELLVSVEAALRGQPGIAVGNVVGSNIFNIAVILGLASVIRPVRAETLAIRRDAPVMIGVTLSGLAVLRDGDVTRLEGAALLLASVFYTVWIVRQARKERVEDDDSQSCLSLTRALIYLAIGLALLAVGSRLLVVNAVILARGWGVSEAVIGLTIIAAGTSMPELATSVVGALRGQSDIAVGNVIGSNIFNLLFVLGAAALIYPIEGARIRPVDQAFLVVTALVLWPIMRSGRTVARREGWLLLGSYGLYLVLMWPKG